MRRKGRRGKRAGEDDNTSDEADLAVAGSRKVKAKAGAAKGASDPGGAPQADPAEALCKFIASLSAPLEFSPASRRDGEDLDAASKAAIREEAPELASTLRKIRQQLGSLRTAAGTALETFAEAVGGPEGNATYVEMKVQLLMSYNVHLVYYLLLKARGIPVSDHPVIDRLTWISTLLDKLRPVDQRVQYQINKLLQWAGSQAAAATSELAQDPHALRPGDLAKGVDDEEEEEVGVAPAAAADEDDKVYKPPKISQMDYTGDHVSMKEKAEKDLDRKKQRLERSEFVRSLQEEFTDAPKEIHGELKSAKAERAARLLREKRDYEEDNLTRLKTKKKESKVQQRLMKEGQNGGGGASLNDLTQDFREMEKGFNNRPGRNKKGRGASALEEYKAAASRASQMRGVVNSTMDGVMPSKRKGGGKGDGGGEKGGGKKRRK